jgi:3-hydroxybutyryl-CoA dehydrogenase
MRPSPEPEEESRMRVKKIGVVGAGIMGRGIAQVAAQGGFQTVLQDIDPVQLDGALASIRSSLQRRVQLQKLTEEEAAQTLERLRTSSDLSEAAAAADLMVEAAPERIDLKVKLFAELDRLCAPECILASNTSSLSITEMAAVTRHPERVVGMHFFNPVPRMALVEIVRALETDEHTIQTALDVAHRMHKETVVVRESPGFVTSRINAMIGNEAFYMLEEGVASARDIDKALKLGLNHPMGPFELVDLVGLDTRLAILEFLHRSLGEKFRPAPLLVQHVKAGRLGKKSGRGVYEYDSE